MTYGFTHAFGLAGALGLALAAAALHTCLEFLTRALLRARTRTSLLHLAVLLAEHAVYAYWLGLLWRGFSPALDPDIVAFYQRIIPFPGITGLLLDPGALERVAAIAVVYAYCVTGGAVFIREVLDCTCGREVAVSAAAGSLSLGAYIGMLERALLLTLLLHGSLVAAGFVLTAKSIARFQELNDRRFAEYYLIGTLSSMLLAVASGLVLQGLLD
ncbi:MAG: hypothetical protein AB1576_10195 [Bacillota bacterium]